MLTYNNSPADLYDSFCHKQDRSYTVPQLYSFVRKAGLEIVKFSDKRDSVKLDLKHLLVEPDMKSKLMAFDLEHEEAIAELIDGTLHNHNVFLSKRKGTSASLDDNDMIPYIYGNPDGFKEQLAPVGGQKKSWSVQTSYWHRLSPYLGIFNFTVKMTDEVLQVLDQLYNNENKTLGDILNEISKKTDTPRIDIENDFNRFFLDIEHLHIILLRGRRTQDIKKKVELLGFCRDHAL